VFGFLIDVVIFVYIPVVTVLPFLLQHGLFNFPIINGPFQSPFVSSRETSPAPDFQLAAFEKVPTSVVYSNH
jgi:hypothetical protein